MLRGSCLCETIRYEIDGRISDIGQCHCSKCRKAFGTGGSTVCFAATASVVWTSGEADIQSYKQASGYGTAFCRKCGSPVPHRAVLSLRK